MMRLFRGGLKFTARSDTALAGVMHKAMGNASLEQALLRQIPISYLNHSEACAYSHKDLYEWIRKAKVLINDISNPAGFAK